MHRLSFLLDHLPKSQRTALSAFLSYRETSELDANVLQTKHEPQNGLKNLSWHICNSLRSFKGRAAVVKLIIKLWLSLAYPLPQALYFIVFYLLFLASQYSSHPPRSCLSPISVITLLSSPHNALNIEGAYKYCWFVLKVFLDDLSPFDLYLPELL